RRSRRIRPGPPARPRPRRQHKYLLSVVHRERPAGPAAARRPGPRACDRPLEVPIHEPLALSLVKPIGSPQPQGNHRPGRQGPATAAGKSARLELEPLEDRSLPSSTGVTGTVISGFVYHDLNNNGLYEPAAGETPYANTGVALLNAAGATVGTTTTDANGYYQ